MINYNLYVKILPTNKLASIGRSWFMKIFILKCNLYKAAILDKCLQFLCEESDPYNKSHGLKFTFSVYTFILLTKLI